MQLNVLVHGFADQDLINPIYAPPTHSLGKDKPVRKKVRPTPSTHSPSINVRGVNRLGNRFVKDNVGGMPRLLPSTDLPIITRAEHELFA